MYDLMATKLETDLSAFACSHCDGAWVRDVDYRTWRTAHGEDLPEKTGEPTSIQIAQFEVARLCPDCKRILIKYKIGHDVNFMVDRCGGCGGVWLDKDEWVTLKDRNLHDNLNDFFTEPWQSEVRRDEVRRNMEFIYKTKFGDEDYERMKSFKMWMDKHSMRHEILAFVSDANPLDV
jgi:Zn-finger nucleic acid-binding protein